MIKKPKGMKPDEARKASEKAKRERLEKMLELHLLAHKIEFAREAELIDGRGFKFDFVILPWDQKLTVEVQGGIWKEKGAHNTGKGYLRDCEKKALAMIQGWRVLYVCKEHIRSGQAIEWIKKLTG